jgi:hypothetical protein
MYVWLYLYVRVVYLHTYMHAHTHKLTCAHAYANTHTHTDTHSIHRASVPMHTFLPTTPSYMHHLNTRIPGSEACPASVSTKMLAFTEILMKPSVQLIIQEKNDKGTTKEQSQERSCDVKVWRRFFIARGPEGRFTP